MLRYHNFLTAGSSDGVFPTCRWTFGLRGNFWLHFFWGVLLYWFDKRLWMELIILWQMNNLVTTLSYSVMPWYSKLVGLCWWVFLNTLYNTSRAPFLHRPLDRWFAVSHAHVEATCRRAGHRVLPTAIVCLTGLYSFWVLGSVQCTTGLRRSGCRSRGLVAPVRKLTRTPTPTVVKQPSTLKYKYERRNSRKGWSCWAVSGGLSVLRHKNSFGYWFCTCSCWSRHSLTCVQHKISLPCAQEPSPGFCSGAV